MPCFIDNHEIVVFKAHGKFSQAESSRCWHLGSMDTDTGTKWPHEPFLKNFNMTNWLQHRYDMGMFPQIKCPCFLGWHVIKADATCNIILMLPMVFGPNNISSLYNVRRVGSGHEHNVWAHDLHMQMLLLWSWICCHQSQF